MNETAEVKNSPSSQELNERRCSRKCEVEKEKEKEKEPPADITSSVYPWRIFVNHIDSYHGSKIADFILDQKFGSSTKVSFYDDEMEGEEEEEEEDKVAEEEEEMSVEQMTNSEEELKKLESAEKLPPKKYQVLATAQSHEYIPDEGIVVIPSLTENKEEFLSQLLTCSFIVYDIAQDKSQIAEANWVLDELTRLLEEYQGRQPRAFSSKCSTRHFVLVSSVLTWARTKPAGEPSLPLTEADRKRRRAHPDYKAELECERNVTRKRPRLGAKLRRLVLCAGVTYGEEEAELHYAFKLGWMNEPRLPVVGAGGNLVPLLHVRDLAAAVYSVIKKWPELDYIIAVEPHQTSQKNLIKAISESLTTGEIKQVTREELLAHPDVSARDCDAISLDLNVAPGYLVESGAMPWLTGSSFLASVERVVQDYRTARNLQPVRLLVLGSPFAGKSMLARALAKHYRLHYLELRKLVADTAQQLINEINEIKKADGESNKKNEDSGNEENEEADDEKEETIKDAQVLKNHQALLDEIQGGLEQNGRLNNDVLTKIFRRKLLSKECQNQGYVMDGYPKTLEQARLLFGGLAGQNDDYEDTEGDASGAEEALIPDLVIVLEASDEFLVDRVINSTERESGAPWTKDEYIYERLRKYRERNNDDDTPLQLFDELEVQQLVFDVEEDTSPQMQRSFRHCLNLIGPPHNYGPSPEEAMEEKRRAEAEAAATAALAAAERERQYAERRREREQPAMEWTELLQNLKLEEEERLCIKSEPLRHYLTKYVFPILIKGLGEVVKLRPSEPIDYLAEYLLKANPEGRDLEPDYTQSMHAMFSSIHKFQNEGVLGGKSVYDYLKTTDGSDGGRGIKCGCCYCKDQPIDVVTIPLSSCGSSCYEKEDECG